MSIAAARQERVEQLQRAAELLRETEKANADRDATIARLTADLVARQQRIDSLEAQVEGLHDKQRQQRQAYALAEESLRQLGDVI